MFVCISGGAEPLEVVVLKECSYEGFQNLLNIIYGVKVGSRTGGRTLKIFNYCKEATKRSITLYLGTFKTFISLYIFVNIALFYGYTFRGALILLELSYIWRN